MLIVRITPQQMVKPAGIVAGNWRIDIDDDSGSPAFPSYQGAAPEMPWPTTLAPGSYRIRGRRLDAEGSQVGGVAETVYGWSGEGAEMIDVAGGVSVVNV